jgi:hypothetical protein
MTEVPRPAAAGLDPIRGSSSDYDDFDCNELDASLFELTVVADPIQLPGSLSAVAPGTTTRANNNGRSASQEPPAAEEIQTAASADLDTAEKMLIGIDKFDDIGDDDYGPDLEDVMIEYDTLATAPASLPHPRSGSNDGAQAPPKPSTSPLHPNGLPIAIESAAIAEDKNEQVKDEVELGSGDEFADLGDIDFDLAVAEAIVQNAATPATTSVRL